MIECCLGHFDDGLGNGSPIGKNCRRTGIGWDGESRALKEGMWQGPLRGPTNRGWRFGGKKVAQALARYVFGGRKYL
jgi:hypothetical protein